MQLEEVLIKLGVDTSQVEPALMKAKVAVDSGAKSFVSAGSAARSFKKMMQELTEQSPLLGTALKLALNPIVGTMTGAVLLFSVVKKHIDELNAKLDTMRDKTSQAWNSIRDYQRQAMATAREIRLGTIEADARNSEKENPAIAALTKGKAGLGGMKDPVQKAKEELLLVAKARADLLKQEAAARTARDVAEDSAADRRRKVSIEKTKEDIENFKRQVEELKKTMPALLESSNAEEKSGNWWIALLPPSLAPKSHQEKYNDAKRLLENYAQLLEKSKDRLEKLTDAEKESGVTLKEKQRILDKIAEELRKVNAEQEKLKGQLHIPDAMPAQTPIDPKTGGYKLKPLQYKPLEYRPIKGAPGYKAPEELANEIPVVDKLAQIDKTLASLLALANGSAGGGITVQGKE